MEYIASKCCLVSIYRYIYIHLCSQQQDYMIQKKLNNRKQK